MYTLPHVEAQREARACSLLRSALRILQLYGMQTRKGQSQRLVPTVHAIESLYSISGSAFQQVVQGSDNHYAPSLLPRSVSRALPSIHPYSALKRVEFKADIAIVTPRQDFWFGITVNPAAFFDQADERLVLIGFAIEPPQRTLIYTLIQKGMGSNKHSAH
jgi:hypothetical protein